MWIGNIADHMTRKPVRTARVHLGAFEFRKKGVSRFDLRDPYHLAIALTWPQFLGALLALYLSVNVVFAALLWLLPGSVGNAQPGSFADAFFFSIETLATVGYGEMYPATPYAHAVVAVEIVCGVAFTAILTGLTFVRFSRPQAKLIFAQNPVVVTHHGKPTLMLRVGNGRAALLADATAKLNVLLSEVNPDGTMVHDIRNYRARDIRFGTRYAQAVTTAADGAPVLDLTRIGAIEPDVGEREEQGWTEREEMRTS